MYLNYLFIFCVIVKSASSSHIDLDWDIKQVAFDPKIYEDALDSELCQEQLSHIRSNILMRLIFLDAGLRFPRGFTQFNLLDLGNYDQCLDIHEDIQTSVIEGKYCLLQVPLDLNFAEVAQKMNWREFDSALLSEENIKKYGQIAEINRKVETILTGIDQSRTVAENPLIAPALRMALCVPKTCTPQEGLSGLLFNLTVLGFNYDVEFCRFKDDKPWVPADYVAISLFSLIALLTILSTSYDVYHTFIKIDPKSNSSEIYKSFSMYTNGKRLTTFTNNPNNVNCLDGIRAISMFWIVAGHTYLLMVFAGLINQSYVFGEWLFDLKSLWITAANYTVDTFLFLAGLLLVYTSVGKITSRGFLKSLHLFYLNRLLRMFPLLATLVLLQASLMFRIADGPYWVSNSYNTESCRTYWWTTLLYVQNYVNPNRQCIMHSWYLAIDIQCYVISPIVLYWCFSKKRMHPWIGLAFGVLATLTVCTTYCFIMKFPISAISSNLREGGTAEYQTKYYFNTLTRAPPFFIGMAFGYLLNTWKGRQLVIPRYINLLLWLVSGALMLYLMYITHLMKQPEWDNWTIDDLHNSFARSAWVVAVGWMIFSCQTGYGGPVNWFLCLDVWKLPSRISYGIYLFHYHIQFVISGMARQPVTFSDALALYYFCAQVLISYGVAFALTLTIDMPCSNLVKLALGGGYKKPQRKE